MVFGAIDLTELVTRLAARGTGRTESDVQSDIRTLLLYGSLNLNDPEVKLESPGGNRRRIDIEVGSAVIEVKKDLRVGNVFEEGREQLAGYVRARSAALDRRYVGLLADGAEWHLFTLQEGELIEVSQFVLTAAGPDPAELCVWLESVLATSERLVPTPFEVQAKLGATSPAFKLDLSDLSVLWAECQANAEVRLKRELWSRLLYAALGTNFIDSDELFIGHTYLVLVAKVIAHAVAIPDFHAVAHELSALELTAGEVFRRSGIGGVVDADFFDWPTDAQGGDKFVSGLARRLLRFDWDKAEHDLLKVLYESVIDKQTRHRLGEYYTPDWLAQGIVRKVVDGPLAQRVLDPGCGSGTFLFWAIRRYFDAADEAGMENADAIAGVVQRVFGVDLHPVAVTLARVTYLLAIGKTRLQADRPSFNVPVYLGDSVQFAQEESILAQGGVTIYTSDGAELFAQQIHFPNSVVADGDRFDGLVSELASRATARNRRSPVPPITAILNRYKVASDDRPAIEGAFKVLCNLYDHHRNHVWGYYIRNLARPVWFSRPDNRVDCLVGNPPWLKYNAMTGPMQETFRSMCVDRRLWAGAAVATSQDLAALFVERSCELYLRQGGRFGFVMPAAALTRPQYAGFREGEFSTTSSVTKLAFCEVPWELSDVEPDIFLVPSCAVFGERSDRSVPLPSEAFWWSGTLPDHHRQWDAALEDLHAELRPTHVRGDDDASPYADNFRQGANLVPRVLLTVAPQPTPALGLPKGMIGIASDRRSPEKEPWKSLPSVSGAVEKRFVRPVLLGETILPYRILQPRLTVIPWIRDHLATTGTLEIDAFTGLSEW